MKENPDSQIRQWRNLQRPEFHFYEEAKLQWRDAHWEEDLQKAFDAGRKMTEM